MKSENSTVAYYGSRAVSLWNSMLLFTSPPVAIMSRTQAFHDTSQLAGGPFRYNRHKWQWSKQLLFSFSCSEVNGTATAPNDKAHKGGNIYEKTLLDFISFSDKITKYMEVKYTRNFTVFQQRARVFTR